MIEQFNIKIPKTHSCPIQRTNCMLCEYLIGVNFKNWPFETGKVRCRYKDCREISQKLSHLSSENKQ